LLKCNLETVLRDHFKRKQNEQNNFNCNFRRRIFIGKRFFAKQNFFPDRRRQLGRRTRISGLYDERTCQTQNLTDDQACGGNKQGINSGNYFFLRLPNSNVEIDIPVFYFSTEYAAKRRKRDAGYFSRKTV
jgi:hypothetical protein